MNREFVRHTGSVASFPASSSGACAVQGRGILTARGFYYRNEAYMFNLFNRAPKQESFKGKDPQGFEMLRTRIMKSALEFDKKHLVEDAQELDRLTERVGRALTMGGESIDEALLSSPKFTETLGKALQVTPATANFMTVDAQGGVLGTAETKKDIIGKIEDERAHIDQNNQ